MSTPENKDGSQAAKERLAKACRTKDKSLRLAWTITIGEAVLLGVTAVALADYWLMLPVWMRTVAAAFIALLLAGGLFRLVRFFRRPTPLKEAALDVEASRPELGCEISTAAEYLSGERQATREYEPELVAALETKAAQELTQVRIPYLQRLWKPAALLGVTVLGLAIVALCAPTTFTALTRILLPFSKIRYTSVQVLPGNAEIPAGSTFAITNIFTGRPPKNPRIEWQVHGQDHWESASLTSRSSEGAYLHTFPDVRSDFTYRVTASGTDSELYQVTTYEPPVVKDLDVQVNYPAYAGLQPLKQDSPDISALRASTAEIQIAPSTKLASAQLRLTSQSEPIPMQPTPGGLWKATVPINKDADYTVELTDEKGRPGPPGEAHHIKAIADTPPHVEIADPGQDLRSVSSNTIPIKISAADDLGVKDVQLVFHKLGGVEQKVSATRETADSGEVISTAELDLAKLDLKDYDVIAYHAEAKDNNSVDGPGIGKSPIYFVEIGPPGTNSSPKVPIPAQKANLLAIQKQLIADTTALPGNSAPEKFEELATRQRDARDLGQIYQKALQSTQAPPAALTALESALQQMEQAAGHLGQHKTSEALVPEEGALAQLYQVLKALPELANLPTESKPKDQQPPPQSALAVALEAIKEKQTNSPPQQEIEQALKDAQQLAEAQSALNAALKKAEQGASPKERSPGAKGKGQGQEPEAQKGQGQAQAKAQGKGQGQGQGQGEGEGEGEGEGQGQGKGKGQGHGQGQVQEQKPGENKEGEQGQGEPQEANDSQLAGEKEPSPQNSDQLAKAPATPKEQALQKDKPPGSEKRTQLAKAAAAKAKAAGQGKKAGKGQGKGKGQARAKGSPKTPGQGQGTGNAPAQPQEQPGEPGETPADDSQQQDATELAQQENAVGQQATALAEKLQRLAGHDQRVGRQAGQNAKLAGQKIADAAKEIRQGNFGAAGANGFQGELALREVVAHLESIARQRPDLTDVADEDAPKEYEPLISDYFKKLSHAE